MLSIFQELEKFNNIIFYDEPHEYYLNGVQTASVTGVIEHYVPPFDEVMQAPKSAKKEGCTVEEILAKWKRKNRIAVHKGKIIHAYIENLLARKIFAYDNRDILDEFGGIDPVNPLCIPIFKQIEDFVEMSKGRLIPIRSEFVIGDEEYGVCGMIDQIFFNIKTQKLEIWDWKSNGKLDTEPYIRRNGSFETLYGCCQHIPKTKYDEYSLQLNMYKHILQKNTNLEIGECRLVWFMEENDSYEVLTCRNYQFEVQKMLTEFKNSSSFH